MDNLKTKVSRCQKLAIPRERFDKNEKIDPFKVKPGALSYRITDSLNLLAKPRRALFQDESTDHSTPRIPKALSIDSAESDAKILRGRKELAKILTSQRRNELDLNSYAQMVKREPLSHRLLDSLNNPRRPRRTFNQNESANYSPRELNVQVGIENRAKSLKNRSRNNLDLDIYKKMVAENDKQCSDRIKRLAKPRRNYFDVNETLMNNNHYDYNSI